MQSLLSLNVKPPTTVLTLAKFVFMTGEVSVLELMRRLGPGTRPRPFYIIAHACNTVAEAREEVEKGANAIECDIQFSKQPWEVATGLNTFKVRHPPDPLGVPIKTYLDGLVKILQEHPTVALVYFDIKDVIDLALFRGIVRKYLTDIVPVQVVFAHANYSGRAIFNPIKQDTEREGLAIDEDDYPTRVSDFFSQEKRLTRFGYGNGVAVPGVPLNIPGSIMRAVALKWAQGLIRWVYTFTLATTDSMGDYIAKGVDGIMVNDVPTLKSIFNAYAPIYHLRLAERGDDPFAPPVHPSYVLTVQTSNKTGAGTDANLTFELRGSAGAAKTRIDAFPAGLFERGDIDKVTLIGKDVGAIIDLTLSQDGVGDWDVATVKVEKRGTPGVLTFYFNQTISPDKPVTRKPG